MSQLFRMVTVLGALAAGHACAPQSISRGGIASDRSDGGDAGGLGDATDAVGVPEAAPEMGGGQGGGTGGVVGGTGGAGSGGRNGGVSGGGGSPGTGGAGRGGSAGSAPDVPAEVGEVAGDVTSGAKVASLIVADPTANAAADAKLKMLLEARGFEVRIGDDDGAATQSDGARIVVLAGTCDSEKLQMKYRTVALPVLVLESESFDDMALTPNQMGTDFGDDNATQIAITDKDSPLAAMFPAGALTVTSNSVRLGWGKPAAAAIKVASLGGSANAKIAVFAYEKTAMMAGGVAAPARRVAMFAGGYAIPTINANADKLIGAAVDWLAQ
jgi:hypothetical protein